MSELRLRPRFSRYSDTDPNDALQRIKRRLSDPECPIEGKVFETSAVLRVRPEKRHFWSPHLEIGLEKGDDTGTVVQGIFGPRPAIWSIFVAAYAAIAFLAVMGVTFGASQWLLGSSPYALWAGPIGLVAATAVYGIARVGRHLGYDQMVELADWVEQSVDGYRDRDKYN